MGIDNEKIVKDMDDVVESATKIQEFFLSDEISLEQKKEYYKFYLAAIEAGKSKVSASVVKVNIEKLTN